MEALTKNFDHCPPISESRSIRCLRLKVSKNSTAVGLDAHTRKKGVQRLPLASYEMSPYPLWSQTHGPGEVS